MRKIAEDFGLWRVEHPGRIKALFISLAMLLVLVGIVAIAASGDGGQKSADKGNQQTASATATPTVSATPKDTATAVPTATPKPKATTTATPCQSCGLDPKKPTTTSTGGTASAPSTTTSAPSYSAPVATPAPAVPAVAPPTTVVVRVKRPSAPLNRPLTPPKAPQAPNPSPPAQKPPESPPAAPPKPSHTSTPAPSPTVTAPPTVVVQVPPVQTITAQTVAPPAPTPEPTVVATPAPVVTATQTPTATPSSTPGPALPSATATPPHGKPPRVTPTPSTTATPPPDTIRPNPPKGPHATVVPTPTTTATPGPQNPRPPSPSAPAAHPGAAFRYTFDTGGAAASLKAAGSGSIFSSIQHDYDSTVKCDLSTSPTARTGTGALQIAVGASAPTGGVGRCQPVVAGGEGQPGTDRWYGYSIQLAPGFNIGDIVKNRGHFFGGPGFRYTKLVSGGSTKTNGPGNNLGIDDNHHWHIGSNLQNKVGYTPAGECDLGEAKEGVWYDVVQHIKWSLGGDGLRDMWLVPAGTPMDPDNPPCHYAGATMALQAFFQWRIGMYFGTQVSNDRTELLDNLALGDSFAAVNPST